MALAGVRNFIADHVIDKTGDADANKKSEIAAYRGFLNLDLTSRTPTVGFFAKSWFYNQMTVGSENILLNQFGGLAKNLGRYSDDIAKKAEPSDRRVLRGRRDRQRRPHLALLSALAGRPRFRGRDRGRFAGRFVRDGQRRAFVSGHALRHGRSPVHAELGGAGRNGRDVDAQVVQRHRLWRQPKICPFSRRPTR